MNMGKNRRLIFFIKIAISSIVIFVLSRSGQLSFGVVGGALADGPVWLVAAALCIISSSCICGIRWWYLLRSQQIDIHPWSALRLTFVGSFFSAFLPGGTGGDIAKAYYIWRDGHRRAAVTTVLLDRVIGLYTMIGFATFIALLHGPALWTNPSTRAFIVCVSASFIVATMALYLPFTLFAHQFLTKQRTGFPDRIAKLFGKLHQSFALYKDRKAVLCTVFLLSLASHAALTLSFIALNQLLIGADNSISIFFLIVPLGIIANSIPFLPMGIGQGEAAFHFLYQSLANSAHGAEAMILFRCINIFWKATGGLFYLMDRRSSPIPRTPQ